MFQNYFKIAIRNLWKNKVFSFINIFGLAISMSVCLLLIMILNDMYSYDRFQPEGEKIYRVITQIENKDDHNKYGVASTTLAVGDVLQNTFGKNIQIVKLNSSIPKEVLFNNQPFSLKNGYYASPSFLKIFDFPLLDGNAQTALQEPNSLVITSALAKKMFGNLNPMGKIVELKGQGSFKITGVLAKLKGKSHFDFEMLASINSLEKLEKEKKIEAALKNWDNVWTSYIYFKVADNQSLSQIQNNLNQYSRKYGNSKKISFIYNFELQNLYAITPGLDLGNQAGKYVPQVIVYFLIGFVVIILLSACFNYANLSTARALTRAKEVGLRKVIGAYRWQLIAQFLIEATVFSLLAFLLACVLLELVWLPGFQTLGIVRQELGVDYKQDINSYLQFLGLSLIIGVISGLSPALYLSSFKPALVLKGLPNLKLTANRLPIRKALIITQFTISLAFVLTTFVIYRQASFLLKADFGFNKDNVVQVKLYDINPKVFKSEVETNPAVKQISFSSHALAGTSTYGFELKKAKGAEGESVAWYAVDENFIATFQLKILAGQGFNQANLRNERNIILNEKAIQAFDLGKPQDAIGKILYLDNDTSYVRVVGVVKDFNHQNIADKIRPLALRYLPNDFRLANIHLVNPDRQAIRQFLEKKWAKLDNKRPLEAEFYDDALINHPMNQIFATMLKIIGVVAFLAIFIAALGLLGMVIYLTEIRTKEIGLRKVLGAEIKQLIFLLARGFAIMLLISIALALPLAWYLNTMWLNLFAYRVSIGIEFFGFGVFLIIALGLLIIIPQTLKIARLNPVDVLRNE
jgi:putative ABC transport system permease protein